MIKASTIHGEFTINKRSFSTTAEGRHAKELLKVFEACNKYSVGGPAAGDPDMVIAERMIKIIPFSEITEYKSEMVPGRVY